MNILFGSTLFILFVAQRVASYSNAAAYGLGRGGLQSFRVTSMPMNLNGVKESGSRSFTKLYAHEAGTGNFEKYKSCLPPDFNVVAAGGWDYVKKLAVDPKAELISSIISSIRNEETLEPAKVDALVALLQSQGKGFKSVLVDGDWIPIYTKNAKKSNKVQKVVSKTEKGGTNAYSNFLVNKLIFENINYTPRKNGMLKATVKYNPVAANFDKTPGGSIVLRRVSCDIIDAFFKYKRIPKISFPFFKRSGGHLDFLYLDTEMRITRGNRGGLFVHLRPEYLESLSI